MKAAARIPLGLVLAYLPMWLPPLARAADAGIGVTGPASSILWNALAVVLLVAYIYGVERRRLDSIRLVRPTGKDLEWALILFGCHMAWAWLVRTIRPPPDDDGTATITAMPVLAVVALVLSAAVFEEVLYRGYPIERLTELTGRTWPALAITVPLFVAPHLVFFSPSWLLYQASGTLALYVLFVWRRNLIACMLLHLAINLPILIPTVAGR
uniref:CPBP family intramembrane glutamic endopeptidase n=1 Tax=Paractinoplanes polyasparticus TaxID=2856853 RepID=UPI001C848198|nr:CPBP family intramembrane glutamic endopeptidase [Actinoplanes polyasparticus]